MNNPVILIIDDDPDLHDMVSAFLTHEGFLVRHAYSANEALNTLKREEPDLILLDMQMPDMDGVTLCGHIRNVYRRPIVFVSGNVHQQDRLRSLQSGGDDYVTKPFDPVELVARVKANLRWSRLLAETEDKHRTLSFPGLTIDPDRSLVTVNGEPVALYAKELRLLVMLARHPNRILHPEQMYRLVWEDELRYSPDTIKTHIHQLRRKIEPNPAQPRYIVTVKGMGYKFNPYGALEATR